VKRFCCFLNAIRGARLFALLRDSSPECAGGRLARVGWRELAPRFATTGRAFFGLGPSFGLGGGLEYVLCAMNGRCIINTF